MKLKLKEKIQEVSKDELNKQVMDLDMKMGDIARAMQEKIPVEVAQEYFLVYTEGDRVSNKDMKLSLKAGKMAKDGKVRLADIFLLADYHNNIRED